MWELDCKEGWALKKWCFWTLVLEKTLESPLDSKEIQPVHPKGNQSWIFIGRTDVKAETPIIWPPDGKNWLIGKDLDAGKDGRQEEKRATEDEMVDSINGDEFEQTQGDSEGQGSLACRSPWGRKELDTTEGRNKWYLIPLSFSLFQYQSFPVSQLFTSGGQSIGASASASALPMSIQDLFPLGLTGLISLHYRGLLRVFFNTTVQKHQFFSAQPSSQCNSHIHTWPQEI